MNDATLWLIAGVALVVGAVAFFVAGNFVLGVAMLAIAAAMFSLRARTSA